VPTTYVRSTKTISIHGTDIEKVAVTNFKKQFQTLKEIWTNRAVLHVLSKEIPKSLRKWMLLCINSVHTHIKELQYNGSYNTKYWKVNSMPQQF
jgi:hypothetical protein